ncbi:MAG TPA: PIN domain-containing protein [Caulobacteraceae bacterium]|nr:PIN domain-containing protein [Caulobacteraceae bacterium]
MIAVDACVVISFLAGDQTRETGMFVDLLRAAEAVLAPSTVAELLSDPGGGTRTDALINGLVLLPTLDGYWRRAGLLRAMVRRTGRKAALGDALVAQACLDADCPLLTADKDFSAFAEIVGLRLAL